MKFYSKKSKSFFAIMCAFFLIAHFSLTAIPVKAAAATPKITYTVTGEATVGKQITINLNVSNISGLYGGSWDFVYDPSIIKVDEITSGDLTSSIPQTTTSNKSGHAYFWFTKTGNTAGISTTEAKSIAKIKATVLKEGTIKIGTTNSDSSFGVNNKSSLVKFSDKNGDKICYSNVDNSINCIKKASPLTSGIYEETSTDLQFVGTWAKDYSGNYSGGSMTLSKVKGDTVTFKINGNGFEIYSMNNEYRGKANIFVDDKWVGTMDQYSKSPVFKAKSFSKTGLTDGVHTVKIEILNEKRNEALSTYIAIDSIKVIKEPILTPNSYDEISNGINYIGSWSKDYSGNYNSGSMTLSKVKGDTVTFKINGNGFEIYSMNNEYRGKANIFVDDKWVGTMDQYSKSPVFKAKSFSKTGLTDGVHTVKIEVLNEKRNEALSTYIAIDSIKVIKEPILTPNSYDEISNGINYIGSWSKDYSGNYNGGSMTLSKVKGDTVTFKINGNGFEIYSMNNEYRGKANIFVDDKWVGTMDQYSKSPVFKAKSFSKTGLTDGVHTVKIEVLNEKRNEALSTYIAIDSIKVIKEPILTPNSYDEISNGINYIGSWSKDYSGNYNGGSMTLSKVKGDTVTFKINGNGFEIYSMNNEYRGKANIFVDDKWVGTMDQYSKSPVFKAKSFSKTGLTDGVHTVKIEVLNEKRNEALSTYIAIDSIKIT